jgi:hypothetical protein
MECSAHSNGVVVRMVVLLTTGTFRLADEKVEMTFHYIHS